MICLHVVLTCSRGKLLLLLFKIASAGTDEKPAFSSGTARDRGEVNSRASDPVRCVTCVNFFSLCRPNGNLRGAHHKSTLARENKNTKSPDNPTCRIRVVDQRSEKFERYLQYYFYKPSSITEYRLSRKLKISLCLLALSSSELKQWLIMVEDMRLIIYIVVNTIITYKWSLEFRVRV